MNAEQMEAAVAATVLPIEPEELERRARLMVFNILMEQVAQRRDYLAHMGGHLHPETEEVSIAAIHALQQLAVEYVSGPQEAEKSEDKKSTPSSQVIDSLNQEFDRTRRALATKLMQDRGVLATFGDDFVIQYGNITVEMEQDQNFIRTNKAELRISQRVTVFSREVEKSAREDIEAESSLREKVNTLLRKYKDARRADDKSAADDFSRQLNELEVELRRYNLRINAQDELESV